jgi:hypothetical protein
VERYSSTNRRRNDRPQPTSPPSLREDEFSATAPADRYRHSHGEGTAIVAHETYYQRHP